MTIFAAIRIFIIIQFSIIIMIIIKIENIIIINTWKILNFAKILSHLFVIEYYDLFLTLDERFSSKCKNAPYGALFLNCPNILCHVFQLSS